MHAAGSGVRDAAIQIAKVMGARLVAGTAGTSEKLAKAAELGLDIGINYNEQDFAEEVLRATEGRGVDVLLDVVGASYWERNMQSLARKGRMVIVGLMGGSAGQVELGVLQAKRLQVRGTGLRARSLEEKALATRAFERSVLPHVASGRIRTVVDRTFPLSDAAGAHRYMETNANFGKIVLEV
ncbi:MAG: zinc-binding dehydrogenase [Dehalococcoidia bacterium]